MEQSFRVGDRVKLHPDEEYRHKQALDTYENDGRSRFPGRVPTGIGTVKGALILSLFFYLYKHF